ncbi:hypothetical protein HPB50_008784 [Hyalomma asiaticum]|uniref:Uncharacterized protein n=1 Tax=Hyalomma asiaticum TaxID=266040 RepID=A0ACB7TH87_HYAAI|nr:hypothetical protein HPB50_008784 [Hyalomma asiaticum]
MKNKWDALKQSFGSQDDLVAANKLCKLRRGSAGIYLWQITHCQFVSLKTRRLVRVSPTVQYTLHDAWLPVLVKIALEKQANSKMNVAFYKPESWKRRLQSNALETTSSPNVALRTAFQSNFMDSSSCQQHGCCDASKQREREGGALYVIRAQACAVEDEVFCCFLLDATYSAYGPVHVR